MSADFYWQTLKDDLSHTLGFTISDEGLNRSLRNKKLIACLLPILKSEMEKYVLSATTIQKERLKELAPYLKSEYRKDDKNPYE